MENINKIKNLKTRPLFLGTYSFNPDQRMSTSFNNKYAITGDFSTHFFNVDEAIEITVDTLKEIAHLISESKGINKIKYNPECSNCNTESQFTPDPQRELHKWKLRTVYNIAPSSLGFLWKKCKRCYINKVCGGKSANSGTVFPSIFRKIDKSTKNSFCWGKTDQIPEIPNEGIVLPELTVSMAIWDRNLDLGLKIYGRPEGICRYENGEFGVLDFKTSEPSNLENYNMQLACYALALNFPDEPVYDHLRSKIGAI